MNSRLAYIALGSNLGDRIGQMRQVLELLQDTGRVRVLQKSPVYQNRAVGMGEAADDFIRVHDVRENRECADVLYHCLRNVEG